MTEISAMPPTRPPSDPVEEYVASMLVSIERNYCREGTGWGSRFEGERLEVVQARAVIRHLQLLAEARRVGETGQ